jgi:hypothetical protein
MKAFEDMVDDIYQHTDSKIDEVMNKTVGIYNELGDYKVDLSSEPKIQAMLSQSIAFPTNYIAPPNFTQRKIQELTEKDKLLSLERAQRHLFRGKTYKSMLVPELVNNIRNPLQLATMHDAFACYKAKG